MRNSIFSKIVSLTVAFAFGLPQLGFAQSTTIAIDSSASQKPTIGQSSSGKPTINIVTPNAGVSVNKFTDFHIGTNGVVINNSAANVLTKTGGTVTGNANLKTSGAANVIVNQIRGAKSKLQGQAEVAGTKAQVVDFHPEVSRVGV